jgi:hypothetical protein
VAKWGYVVEFHSITTVQYYVNINQVCKLYVIPQHPMDFNKLATSKRQANLSHKAQAYVDNGSARPAKRKNISNDPSNVDQSDDTPRYRKGRLAENNGVGLDSNPHIQLIASRSVTASGASFGNSNVPTAPKMGRSSQGNSMAHVPSTGASDLHNLSSSDVEIGEVVEGQDSDEDPATEPKETDEEMLGI